jgi:hypothetical protein
MRDAEFCESKCPVCTNARKGRMLPRLLQRMELFLTRGKGCPSGRARFEKYGVAPDEMRPDA